VAPAVSGRSPFGTTYVALGVLVALGAYIYFVERERDPDAGERLFATLDAAAVHSVTIAPKDGETIQLERDGEEAWRIAEPIQVPADSASVQSLLTAVEELELDEALEETGERLADFGLDEPRVALTLAGADGAELLSLELGAKAPGDSFVYARASGRAEVVTIAPGIETDLEKKPFDFRVRDVLGVQRDAIARLEVSGPEGAFTLEKREGDSWTFTRPLKTLAGRWTVDSLVGLVAGLKMESVAAEQAEDLAAFGLDHPERTVEVGLDDGTEKTLEIGTSPEEGKYHAREASSRLVAVIPGALVDDLAKGMSELRAKRLLDVSTFDVEGVTAELASGERVWARSGEAGAQKWTRTEPEEADVETSKVDDALYKLTGLDVTSFVDAPGDDASYGLAEPAGRITLRREDDAPEVEVVFGRTEDSAYARRTGDDAVLELDASEVDGVLEAFGEL